MCVCEGGKVCLMFSVWWVYKLPDGGPAVPQVEVPFVEFTAVLSPPDGGTPVSESSV